MLNKKQQGFTLIELLVVIAIIGILSSVVLASLNTAREKANQASVQSNLKTIQVQAEMYYDDHDQAYGSAGNACSDMFVDTTIGQALAAATSSGSGTSICAIGIGGQTWAVSVPFKDSSDTWCADSTGFAGSGTSTGDGSAAVNCQ